MGAWRPHGASAPRGVEAASGGGSTGAKTVRRGHGDLPAQGTGGGYPWCPEATPGMDVTDIRTNHIPEARGQDTVNPGAGVGVRPPCQRRRCRAGPRRGHHLPGGRPGRRRRTRPGCSQASRARQGGSHRVRVRGVPGRCPHAGSGWGAASGPRGRVAGPR